MRTNCIICKTGIENWDVYNSSKSVIHPINGTAFRTYGHYGSTVFDPMDGSFLEIVICDNCLKDNIDYAYPQKQHPHSTEEYVKWMASVWKANDERNTK